MLCKAIEGPHVSPLPWDFKAWTKPNAKLCPHQLLSGSSRLPGPARPHLGRQLHPTRSRPNAALSDSPDPPTPSHVINAALGWGSTMGSSRPARKAVCLLIFPEWVLRALQSLWLARRKGQLWGEGAPFNTWKGTGSREQQCKDRQCCSLRTRGSRHCPLLASLALGLPGSHPQGRLPWPEPSNSSCGGTLAG